MNNNHLAGNYSGEAAKTYRQRRFESSGRMKKLHNAEMSFAENLLHRVDSNDVVLDIPCGSGRFTSLFGKTNYVYSVDLSEDMLNEARKGVSPGFKGKFILANALDIPLADASVDISFCMRLLHHIGDPEIRKQVLCELGRVSKRWVAVSFYRKESYRYYRKKLFGKKISGQPIAMDLFAKEALECGLCLVDLMPKKPLAFFNASAQTLVLFEKKSSIKLTSCG